MESIKSVIKSGYDNFNECWNDPSSRSLYLLSFLYYFGTGIHNAYDITFSWTYLQDNGVTHTDNSVVRTVLYLPQVLKLVFALMSDRYRIYIPGVGSGHRRPYIFVGIILNFLGFSLTGLAIPEKGKRIDLTMYTVLQFIDMTGLVMADTNMDALLIEMTPADREAQVQATVGIGIAFGTATGAIAFGSMQAKGQYETYFFVCGAVFTVFMLMSLPFSSEPEEESDSNKRQPFKWEAFNLFCEGDTTTAVWAAFWYMFFGRASTGIMQNLVAPILESKSIFGYQKNETGYITGLAGFMFVTGSGVAAALNFSFGLTLALATVLLAVGGILIALLQLESIEIFTLGFAIVMFAGGIINVIISACLMILSEPEINASFFSLAMITYNAGNLMARIITGPLVDSGTTTTTGPDGTPKDTILLQVGKVTTALWIAFVLGIIGLVAIPSLWTGVNERVAQRRRLVLESQEGQDARVDDGGREMDKNDADKNKDTYRE